MIVEVDGRELGVASLPEGETAPKPGHLDEDDLLVGLEIATRPVAVAVAVAVAVGAGLRPDPLQELILELDQARVDLDPAPSVGGAHRSGVLTLDEGCFGVGG